MKPTARIAIDLNVRVRGNGTYSGFEHVKPGGIVTVGREVEVYENETGAVGRGRVTDVDVNRRLVFLDVDWTSISIPPQILLNRTPMPFELEVRAEAEPSTRTLTFQVDPVAA